MVVTRMMLESRVVCPLPCGAVSSLICGDDGLVLCLLSLHGIYSKYDWLWAGWRPLSGGDAGKILVNVVQRLGGPVRRGAGWHTSGVSR